MIGDGGDFVSYAGKLDRHATSRARSSIPGRTAASAWDRATRSRPALAHPDRQVVLLLGDGAIGFALGDFEALVRHGVNVVAIVGNNGIWGLEKHPMQALFGYDVVAELRPASATTRWSTALGGHGELVDRRRTRSAPRSTARSRPRACRSSTCSPTRPTPTRGRATSPERAATPDRQRVRGRACASLGAEAGAARGPWPSSARGRRGRGARAMRATVSSSGRP